MATLIPRSPDAGLEPVIQDDPSQVEVLMVGRRWGRTAAARAQLPAGESTDRPAE